MNVPYLVLGDCSWFCPDWQLMTFFQAPVPRLLGLCYLCLTGIWSIHRY